jgi:hypothetical protein
MGDHGRLVPSQDRCLIGSSVTRGNAMSDSDPGSSNVSSKLKVIFGALLLLVAARLWQRRPNKGMAATSPGG